MGDLLYVTTSPECMCYQMEKEEIKREINKFRSCFFFLANFDGEMCEKLHSSLLVLY